MLGGAVQSTAVCQGRHELTAGTARSSRLAWETSPAFLAMAVPTRKAKRSLCCSNRPRCTVLKMKLVTKALRC